MLIRAVEIEGLNCFGTPFRFDGFSESVSVLFGPNGIGKSSLIQGIAMAFLRPHRSTAESVMRFKPWDRRLHPAVKVEFDHAGHRYRVSKRFLQRPEARIERQESGRWNLFAQSDAAETFLQDMLKSAGGRVATGEHMSGFAQVLWATQGHLDLPALGESVVTAIRASVGAQISAPSKNLEQRIANAYSAVFTRTGRLKEGQNACEQVRLEADIEAAHKEVLRWRDAVVTHETAVSDIGKLEPEAADETARVERLAAELAILHERSKRYVDVLSRVRELDARRDSTMARWTAANNMVQVLQHSRGKVKDLSTEIVRLDKELSSVSAAHEHATAAHQAALLSVAECEAAETAARTLAATAALACEYIRSRKRKEEVDCKLGHIADASEMLESVQAELTSLHVPPAARMSQLQAKVVESRELRQRLELARIRLLFTPERDCEILIGSSQVHAVAGQPIELAGDPNLALTIKSVGEFAIAGPVSNFESTQQQLEQHYLWLNAFAHEFGTADVDEITARCNKQKELQSAVRAQQALIANLLSIDTESALSHETLQLQSRIAEIERSHPAWVRECPQAETMSETAGTTLSAAANALADARTREKEQHSALTTAAVTAATLRSQLDGARERFAEAAQTLGAAEADGKTDAIRQEELNVASAELVVARRELQTAEQERAACGADPATELEIATKNHAQAVQCQTEIVRNLNLLRGRLDQLCAEAAFVQLNRAEEAYHELSSRLAEVTLKTDALALLKRTLDDVRAELLALVSEPIESAASTYVERICGRPFARIRLNADFATTGVVPNGHLDGECVEAERMSGGEQEQIHLCTRLALATELARNERQVLILDDVLTVTDGERMQRINELIQDCGRRLQILILTCHPERFQTMSSAKFFDMQALIIEPQREVA